MARKIEVEKKLYLCPESFVFRKGSTSFEKCWSLARDHRRTVKGKHQRSNLTTNTIKHIHVCHGCQGNGRNVETRLKSARLSAHV